MSPTAPPCGIDGCETPSWGPCDRHVVSPVDSPEATWAIVRELCPALEGPMHPAAVRTAIDATVISVVEARCTSIFPSMDSHDPSARDQQLYYLRDALAEPLRPMVYSDVDFHPVGMAKYLQNIRSTTIEEIDMEVLGQVAVSYLHYAERNLARSMGYTFDSQGILLNQPLQDYQFAHHYVVQERVRDAFADVLRQFPIIVEAANDRPPLSREKPPLDLFLKGHERNAHHSEQVQSLERSAKNDERKEKFKRFVVQQLEEYNSPESRAARTTAREARERSNSRKIKDEYYTHLNRRHRQNQGWFF